MAEVDIEDVRARVLASAESAAENGDADYDALAQESLRAAFNRLAPRPLALD